MASIEELTDTQIEQIETASMNVPGVTKEHDSDMLIEECGSGCTYIKFMSDHGVTDDANGLAFKAFLTANNVEFTSQRPRSLIVDNGELVRLFSTPAEQA